MIGVTVSGGVRQDPNGAGGKEHAVLVFRSSFYSTVLRQGLSRGAAGSPGSLTAVEPPTQDNNDSGDGESNGGDGAAPRCRSI